MDADIGVIPLGRKQVTGTPAGDAKELKGSVRTEYVPQL